MAIFGFKSWAGRTTNQARMGKKLRREIKTSTGNWHTNQPSFYQERRRIGKSEWQEPERTDVRQFCDFHSTEQQILANPELQEHCRHTLDIPGPRICWADVPMACVLRSNGFVESVQKYASAYLSPQPAWICTETVRH